MYGQRRDRLVGLFAAGIAITAYLFLAPSGRALRVAIDRLPPDTPRDVLEDRLGGRGESSPDVFFCYFGPHTSPEQFDRINKNTVTTVQRYSGAMFAVDIWYMGGQNQRAKDVTCVPELRLVGGLYLLATVVLAVSAARLSRAVRTSLRGGARSP